MTLRQRVLVVSSAMTAVGLLAGVILLDGATELADLSARDPSITAAAVRLRTPWLTTAMQVFTTLGGTIWMTVLTVAVAAYLVVRWHRPGLAAWFVAGMLVAATLATTLKNAVGRHRPPLADLIGPPAASLSFPSGHALSSTVAFGLLLALGLDRTRLQRVALPIPLPVWVGGCILMPLLIGLSRVYLGYHWATDVVAGWSLGIALVGVVFVAYGIASWPTDAG